ncbi:MAG: AI-2E family transporter [Candidatus Magasanikbacteria bacterium]
MIKGTANFSKMRSIFFFGLIGILTLGVLYLFAPFFYPIFWAAVLAVIFYPLYKWFLKLFKKEGISAGVSASIVFLMLISVVSILSFLLVNQSISLYNDVSSSGVFQNSTNNFSSWLEKTPLSPYFTELKNNWTSYINDFTKNLSVWIVNFVKDGTTVSIIFVFKIFIMFYTLYYFFKDGKRLLIWLEKISPLGNKYEVSLYDRFTSTVRATLKSTLFVGTIQGTLGGFIFWLTGIKGAFVWGVIMVIIAIIPAVGPSLVLGIAAIIMLVVGNIWQAIVLAIATVVISFVDNLIRPAFIGKDIQMHPLLVFFSILGGLALFGASGFVIGPVIAALYLSVIAIYESYYKKELKDN